MYKNKMYYKNNYLFFIKINYLFLSYFKKRKKVYYAV